MSSSFLYSLAREIHNGTQGLSKDKSPTCKHLTVSVCQLMKEPIRSLSLQHTQLKLEANPTIPAKGELEEARVMGSPGERGLHHYWRKTPTAQLHEGRPLDLKELSGSETANLLAKLTMSVTNSEASQGPGEERAFAKHETNALITLFLDSSQAVTQLTTQQAAGVEAVCRHHRRPSPSLYPLQSYCPGKMGGQ